MKDLIGRPVSFVPCCAFKKEKYMADDAKPVRGVIEYVNEEHGWFRCKYHAGNEVQHECFKECDIGTAVTLLGRR